MDQNTFNFWYTQYINTFGYYPPSPDYLNHFIQTHIGYYNQVQPQYFIPIAPQPVLYQKIEQSPTVEIIQNSEVKTPEIIQNSEIKIPEINQNSEVKKPEIILNKKYGLKNKEDCSLGMSCKNIYCKYFHHPSADPDIFLVK